MLKIILIAILQSMTIASGVVIPFFMGYGSSASDIFLFTAVYQVAILLLEIPTGLIASKYGEKTSIILWFLLSAFYYIALAYTTSPEMFLILQWLLGCSVAFLSWSLNTFMKHFATKEWVSYVDIRKKYKIVTLVIGILATIVGWLLSTYATQTIFLFQALIYLTVIWVVISIPYNPEHSFVEKSYLSMIKKSIAILRQKDIFLPTIFIYSFLAIEAWIYVWFQTRYIWTLELPKEFLGIGLWIFVLVSTFFTAYLPKQKRVLSKWFFVVIALCFIVPIFLNVAYPSVISLWLLYITQVIRPMDIPVEDKILNIVTDNTWSTVLSFVGFYERVGFMIITCLIEFFHLPAFSVLWWASIFLLGAYLIFTRKNKVNLS